MEANGISYEVHCQGRGAGTSLKQFERVESSQIGIIDRLAAVFEAVCCPVQSVSVSQAHFETVPCTGLAGGSLGSLATLSEKQRSLHCRIYFIASLHVSSPECSCSIRSLSAGSAAGHRPHLRRELSTWGKASAPLLEEVSWSSFSFAQLVATLFP